MIENQYSSNISLAFFMIPSVTKAELDFMAFAQKEYENATRVDLEFLNNPEIQMKRMAEAESAVTAEMIKIGKSNREILLKTANDIDMPYRKGLRWLEQKKNESKAKISNGYVRNERYLD